ncbi:class I SAM-dependent methyltransferase [Micromonospora sp. DT229]|uniref:class I SAM-dependent methyltransferase n=1 Tax=Micromonospora sp. DT229 TaxID=3393430 RepID=UPI003CF6F29C
MTDRPTREESLAGTAVYTPQWLAEYDQAVLGDICRRVWCCDRSVMLDWYDRHIGDRHVDVGPGTGFFLDNCRHRTPRPRIALVDLNPTVLAEAAGRLRRFEPVTLERDVLAPFDVGAERFDSAGLNFLLHCLPGGMAYKAQVLDHVRTHIEPGGWIFGSTVLAEGVTHTPAASRLLATLNDSGTFSNRTDSLTDLRAELAARFADFQIVVHGSVALFRARN